MRVSSPRKEQTLRDSHSSRIWVSSSIGFELSLLLLLLLRELLLHEVSIVHGGVGILHTHLLVGHESLLAIKLLLLAVEHLSIGVDSVVKSLFFVSSLGVLHDIRNDVESSLLVALTGDLLGVLQLLKNLVIVGEHVFQVL